MAKKRKLSPKEKIKLFINIFLIILIGICFGVSVMYGVSQDWIGFAIYFSVAIVISAIEIQLYYHGTIYECPHCGNKFKVNSYKVFFTNGILEIFDSILSFGDGSDSKYAKLKCTNCKKKDWCKKHYN
jgi:radical SAM protein with 4Fe4S-binding SPASM domain